MCRRDSIKADDEKHTPLIDEDAAVIVRRILEQRARGLSPKQIAIQLNKDGIATPSDLSLIHIDVYKRQQS